LPRRETAWTADATQLKAMRAKTAVMRPCTPACPRPADQAIVDALAGFEATYPEQADLLPQVWRLRLGADCGSVASPRRRPR